MIRYSLQNRQQAKVRIAVQVSKGRVLNSQLSRTVDFKAGDGDIDKLVDDALEQSMEQTNIWFCVWRDELAHKIESRAEGWLRLMVAVEDGAVKYGNSNPSFDMKPT
jgi:hypothetical protein